MKFDASWRATSQWISPNAETGAQDDRYRNFGLWLATHSRIEMCCAGLEGDHVVFANGRHRFSWLRDHGVRAMPVQTGASLEDIFRERFGTRSRVSELLEPQGWEGQT